MGSKNIIDYLKDADKECQEIIGKSEKEIKDFITDYQTRFNNSVNSEIYTTFGEYLSNALGKKINSQVKNKILSAWIENHKSELTTTDKVTGKKRALVDDEITSYIASYNERNNYYVASNRKEYRISHACVGAGFGLGYVTPTKSIRSINIPPSKLFFYITQEHVDLISNKQKRACAQEFLTFRDSFIKIRDELAIEEVCEDLSIPVDTAIFKKITIDNSIHNDRYDRNKNMCLAYDKIAKYNVNTVEIRMVNVNLREAGRRHGSPNRSDNINALIDTTSRNLRSRFESILPLPQISISISAFNNGKDNIMTFFGSVNLQEKDSLTPLDIDFIKADHSVCHFAKDIPSQYYVKDWSPATKNAEELKQASGYLLNWKDIIGNEKVSASIDKRIKFFEIASKTLHHLKKKHAALVFVFGMF